ncbi:MAG: DUF364 domain-containing protein [Thermotogae bacterium]|nr:DUF364 domain-containing protein [Thermotogota bacterium]
MGIGLCAVAFDDGRAGVAYTDRKAIPWGCSLYDELPGCDVRVEEFIEMFDSEDTLMRSMGMATINACINQGKFRSVDVMKEVDIFDSDIVGMIGYFDPMVEDIKKRAKRLYIFEKEKMPDTFSPDRISDLVPECDVLLISATTIINRTFDSIIECARTKEIAMLGPSAPICPEAFPEVSVFGGTIVIPDALKTVYHGGGTKNLYREKTGKKVVFIPENGSSSKRMV